MQMQPFQLIRQQLILKELGFYTGPLDGVWGPDCIDAMQRYENRLDLYRPARPSCGLPFADGARLPSGLWFSRDGMICSDKVPEAPSPKELEARVAFETKEARGSRRHKDKPAEVVAESAAPAVDPLAETKAKIVQEDPPKQNSQKHQQQHQGKRQ